MSLIRINVVYGRHISYSPSKQKYISEIHTIFIYEGKQRKKIYFKKKFCNISKLYRENLIVLAPRSRNFFSVYARIFLRVCPFYELNCCEVDRNMKKRLSQIILTIFRINDIV